MISKEELLDQKWFSFLTKQQQTSVQISFMLSDLAPNNPPVDDYSYIVFPIAKAYEGFLKKYLFVQGLINVQTYEGHRFRIGRSLNPDVHQDQRDEYWLYDDVVRICGKQTAREIWSTWLTCRNQVFHYFVKDPKQLSLDQAKAYQNLIIDVMKKLTNCIKEGRLERQNAN